MTQDWQRCIGMLSWDACLECAKYSEEEGCPVKNGDLTISQFGDSVYCDDFVERTP